MEKERQGRRDRGNFASGSVPSNILRMAVPMTVAQIINVLYNLVDRMYIGRMADVGRLALTGIGIGDGQLRAEETLRRKHKAFAKTEM